MPNIATPKRAGISDIPPEILGEIFVDCLPVDLASQSQNTQQLLSNVCGLWRTLVLVTPACWASLNIICNVNVVRPPLSVIHTHLQHSGTHPLSFSLNVASPQSGGPNPNLLPVLTGLITARQRWYEVDIKFARITEDILDLITLGDAPLLQSIRCFASISHGLPIPLRMLDRCPRLESFRWHGFGSHLLLPRGSTQLTSLSLQATLSVSACVTLLRLSPRLTSVALHGLDIAGRLSVQVPHLTHLTLCTLTVIGTRSDKLLNALTLPALLDMDLVVTPFDQLSMSIIYAQSPEPAVLRILALAPHLCHLDLSGCRLTAMFIHALHPPPQSSAPLCPRLQELSIDSILDCPDGLCGAMIRARWGAQALANGVACLKQTDIGIEGGVHDCDRADVEELCAEGMQAGFYFGGPSV